MNHEFFKLTHFYEIRRNSGILIRNFQRNAQILFYQLFLSIYHSKLMLKFKIKSIILYILRNFLL